MVNKLEFNNLVITNKKKIQSIKTQTIQKLVHKIKKLKYILEKKPEHEKNKERFRKATLSLEELKKLKCLDLMKHVLVLEKSPSAIITNGLCGPEEMSVAMVAANKMMHELVNTFREKLGFTLENQLWKNELMQTSKRRIKFLRTEQKRKSRQDLKEQKIMARKRVEWLKNQNGEQSVDADNRNAKKSLEDDEGANVSTLGYWKIEPIGHDNCKNSKKEKMKKKLANEKHSAKKRILEENSANIMKSVPKVLHLTEEIKLSDTTNREVATNNIDSSKSMTSGLKVILNRQASPGTLKEDITHVIDPFFITSSGENYRSSAVIVRNGLVFDPQTNKIHESNKAFENESKKSRGNYAKVENLHNFSANNKRVSSKNPSRTVKENNTEGIHPSWAAKQKLKPVIGSFQGKKIKFDDNDTELQTKDQSNKKLLNKENGRKNHIAVNKRLSQAGDQDLHPSWLAKQKLKPAIIDFKGKKIIFGDGDDEITKTQETANVTVPTKKAEKLKTIDALHPSWVAKQNLKSTITAFQGKRITFKDD